MNRAEIEGFLEPLLGALRRRDFPVLEKLSRNIAARARRARASFVQSEKEIDAEAHLLGALEVMEAIGLRATARHAANAQREAARRQGALKALRELARAPEKTMLPSQLAARLRMLRPNISRLLKQLATVDLVAYVESGTDARQSPVRLTEAGLQVLAELMPDWRIAQATSRSFAERVPPVDVDPELAAVKQYGVFIGERASASTNLLVLSPRVHQLLQEANVPRTRDAPARTEARGAPRVYTSASLERATTSQADAVRLQHHEAES